MKVNVRQAGQHQLFLGSATMPFTLASAAGDRGDLRHSVSCQPAGPGRHRCLDGVASGGSGNYQYQFWLYNGTSWSIAKAYGATNDNTWTWNTTGLATGTYRVQVWARSAGSTAGVRSVHVAGDLRPEPTLPATGVTLNSAAVSRQPAGTGSIGDLDGRRQWRIGELPVPVLAV